MSSERARLGVIGVVTLLIVTGAGVGLYVYLRPYFHGTNCEARTSLGVVPLQLDQSANAATIAAVALRRHLPERAVTIAYATAMQESHLRNVEKGDRDSVGLFQQRPSQGWGTADQLKDPAYAASKFFSALVKVKNYDDMPVHEAAQRVQRSADGSAYAQHETDAKILAAAYTGRPPAAVRCWYPPNKRKKHAQVREATAALLATLDRRDPGHTSTADSLTTSNSRTGWTMAVWMVSHAHTYGLREIRYAGRHWRVSDGHDGWTKDKKAPADRVVIK